MRPVAGSVGVVHVNAGWTRHLDAYMIQIGTQSRYNHTAIVSKVEGNRLTIVEAMANGVRERELERWEIPFWRFEADPEVTPEQRQAMVAEARRLIGTPYDFGDILKFVVRFITGKVTTKRRDYADDRVICSELVSWCLHIGGVNPWPNTAYGAISPGDIAEWMFALNSTFKV